MGGWKIHTNILSENKPRLNKMEIIYTLSASNSFWQLLRIKSAYRPDCRNTRNALGFYYSVRLSLITESTDIAGTDKSKSIPLKLHKISTIFVNKFKNEAEKVLMIGVTGMQQVQDRNLF